MLDSGLRFAFAFLPAGVAIVVGLVLAVQRRRIQPAVATPAIAGLALQLVAALLSASTVVLLPALLRGGSSTDTVLTASSLIGVLTALVTVLGWVLLLIALFRRLPAEAPAAASAPASTPSSGISWQRGPARGMVGQPPADDAPTGRHALLDEHGQQVVAQPGVRLSPRTAALTGGAALGAGAAVGAGVASRGDEGDDLLDADDEATLAGRDEDLPTEAVPIAGHRPADADVAGTTGDSPEAASAPDAGPGGVDEAAVGGVPTHATAGTETDPDAAAPASAPGAAPAAASGGVPRPWPGAAPAGAGAGVAGAGAAGAAAVGAGAAGAGAALAGTSTEPEEHDAAADAADTPETTAGAAAGSAGEEPVTETMRTHTPAGTPAADPGAHTDDVDEAAPGTAPSVAADPPADPSDVSVDESAVGGVPASANSDHDADDGRPRTETGHDDAVHDESDHVLDHATADQAEIGEPDGANGDGDVDSDSDGHVDNDGPPVGVDQPEADSPSHATGPSDTPATSGAGEATDTTPTPGAEAPGDAAGPEGTAPEEAVPAADAPSPGGAVPAAGAVPPAGATPPAGVTPPARPVPPVRGAPRVGAVPPFGRAHEPTSTPTGEGATGHGDLFTPGVPPEESIGGTPTGASPAAASEAEPASDPGEEERPGLVDRAKAQVAGWFEPVTSSQDRGFGPAGSWRDEPPSNGHHQGG